MTGSVKELRYIISGFLLLMMSMFVLTRYTGYYIPFSVAFVVSCCGILFYLAGIDKAFHIVLFSLPLALSLPVTESSRLMFPSELLVASLGIAVVIYWVLHPAAFVEMIIQPLSFLITGYLIFLLISVFFFGDDGCIHEVHAG